MIFSGANTLANNCESIQPHLVHRPDAGPQMAVLMAQNKKPLTAPQPLGEARWDWSKVRKVLVVRLRSIGDTVLATPSLHSLRRFLPDTQLDILLEDWVAPVLDGFPELDNVITVERKNALDRARVARRLRASHYDVVYNLHGGTTSTFLTWATGAQHRVGFSAYRYNRLHNHSAPSPIELWGRTEIHSVEQQLSLLGWTGVPVSDLPLTRLSVTPQAETSVDEKLRKSGIDASRPIALLHPAAAFDTKQWATEKFARIADYLYERGLAPAAIVAPQEVQVAVALKQAALVSLPAFTDLSLPEVTALASRARIFVGNDSGIAHIAAAVSCPSVVIFGSSNVMHWRPWTGAPSAIVREELPCQPCPGYTCGEFDQPECIRRVPVESVRLAIKQMLDARC
jgi:lipopolysaccharide heptosyltransferase II